MPKGQFRMRSSEPEKQQPRSRLEDEVLEILSRTDRKPPVSARARSIGRTLRARILDSRDRLGVVDNPWGWFALGIVIFLVGGAITGESGLGERIVQYAGLAAIVVGLVRMFRPSRASGGRKMWRGRVIDMNRRGVELGDKWDDWKRRR